MKKLQITFEVAIVGFLITILPFQILKAGWPPFIALFIPLLVVVLLYLEKTKWNP